MRYLILLFLFACASEPLSQADREYNEQIERERIESYCMWAAGCSNANGIVFTENPWRSCRNVRMFGRRFCVPHKNDWDTNKRFNNTQCVSQRVISEMFQR